MGRLRPLAARLDLPGDAARLLRAFRLIVLRQLGHLPDLSLHSARGQPLLDEVRYTVDPELGVTEAQADDPSLPGWLLRQLEATLSPVFDDLQSPCRSLCCRPVRWVLPICAPCCALSFTIMWGRCRCAPAS